MATALIDSSSNSDGFLESEIETELSSNDEEELLEQPLKRKRGAGKIYLDHSSYPSSDAALKAIKEGLAETNWTQSCTRITDEGKKIFFDCTTAGKRAKCPVALSLLIKLDNSAYTTLSENEHIHEIQANNRGIPLNIRPAIELLFNSGVTKP